MPVEPCPYFRPRLALNGRRIGGELRVHDAFQFGAVRGGEGRQLAGIFDRFGGQQTPLALDEIAASNTALFVVFDHAQLFTHVEGAGVFLAWSAAFGVFSRIGKNLKVLPLDKAIFFDTTLNPSCKDTSDAKNAMKRPSVNGETLNIADSAGDNGNELGSGHNDLRRIVVLAFLNERCRVSTTSTDATLISLAGFVFRVIDPAKYAGRKGIIAQKETQQKSRAGARVILKQRRGHCRRDSEVTVAVSVGECQGEFWGIPQRERPGARNRLRTAGALLLPYSGPISNVGYTTSQDMKKAIDKRNGNRRKGVSRLRETTTP